MIENMWLKQLVLAFADTFPNPNMVMSPFKKIKPAMAKMLIPVLQKDGGVEVTGATSILDMQSAHIQIQQLLFKTLLRSFAA